MHMGACLFFRGSAFMHGKPLNSLPQISLLYYTQAFRTEETREPEIKLNYSICTVVSSPDKSNKVYTLLSDDENNVYKWLTKTSSSASDLSSSCSPSVCIDRWAGDEGTIGWAYILRRHTIFPNRKPPPSQTPLMSNQAKGQNPNLSKG